MDISQIVYSGTLVFSKILRSFEVKLIWEMTINRLQFPHTPLNTGTQNVVSRDWMGITG